MLKKTLISLLSAVLIFPCAACESNAPASGTPEPVTVENAGLEVTFLDVGKADAIVLLSDNSTVIIDCGEKSNGKDVVNFLKEKERTVIDYLIITHYDKDHVGGAGKVINNFDVKNVLAPDYEEQSEEMDKYRTALNGKGLTPTLLTEDMTFELDGMSFTVDAPDKTFYAKDDDNDLSLVTKVVHGENTLLFTGDAMEERLKEIMDIGDCTLLKVPYHGRKIANFGEFLDAVKPEYAVVSTSRDEFAGTIQKLMKARNIPFCSTCFNGRITAVSDGKNISVTSEKGT
ncbi:MAG: MBL fold metallo-hydrolase [Ruminococcus sp.]|nr:MBL fold metallo-hydrolase [Ruminococcus sp.]